MKVYRDTIVRTQVHSGFSRNGRKPDTIVIHGTAGGGTLNWFRYGHKNPNDKYGVRHKQGVGLTHYLIELDGKIIEIIDTSRWVYHSSSGKEDARTIGIELENLSRKNENEYTNKQYQSLASLIHYLESKFGFLQETTHNAMKQKYSGGSKNCPGKKFSFYKLNVEKLKQTNPITAGKKISKSPKVFFISLFLLASIYNLRRKANGRKQLN